MVAKSKGHEVIPSAKRLIGSLRDMGYDFSTAVADLIDNSIEAGATVVNVDVEFDGDDSWVRIADNGLGMSASQLQEAMRYGSEREYDGDDDLGKFGLGLKTASMSQCQRLVVASKGNMHGEVSAFSWDLDHINATNKWEILKVNKRELKKIVGQYLDKTRGTIIFWQRLDRILGYKHPYGENAKKRMIAMCRELEEHLAMVIHRFLTGEVPGKKLRIILNGNQVKAWDPFARNEKKTRVLDPITIRLEHEGKAGTIILEPYILPHQDDFSSSDAFKQASGPRKWNRQQGFYIYRANRLIQSGGWSGLKTVDEHLKLARVAISFSPHLDDAFKINVAKMRVQLPNQIRDEVDAAIKPTTKLAQATYRRSNAKTSTLATSGKTFPVNISGGSSPNPVNLQPEVASNSITSSSQKNSDSHNQYWTLDEMQDKLIKLAEPTERHILLMVFERLRKALGK